MPRNAVERGAERVRVRFWFAAKLGDGPSDDFEGLKVKVENGLGRQ